ncbi:unnamed protein product [Sphacelaria rigidula]
MDNDSEPGLLGGIFSRQGHGEIHVKFSDVDWATLVRSGGFLSQQEVEMLQASDESPVEYLVHNEAEARKYVRLLMKLMGNLTSDTRAQQFAVSRTEDIVAEDISRRARLFCEPGKPLDQTPFLRVISSGDAAVQQIASVSLALLIVSLKAETESLTAWICRQLSTGRGRSQGVRGAVQALCVLLRDDDARIMFTRHGGVGSLTKILRMQGGDSSMSQLLYELCFCLWSVSLCEEARHDFMSCGAVPILAQQVAAASTEKVIRVSLAALKHLTEGEVGSFNAEMIACGLPKTLEHMKNRKFADPDIAEDVDVLYQ